MEYLLVIGFSLAIILPVTALLYHEYQQNKTDLYLDHLSELSRELAFQAEKLSYQGAPATTTITASLPPGVTAATIHEHSIEFTLENSPISIYADTASNLLPGTLPTYPGPHTLMLTVEEAGQPGPADDVVHIFEPIR